MSEDKMIKKSGKGDIRSLIMSDRMKEQLALALPKSLTPDRMVRVALTAINKTPKLMNCSQQSLLASIMTCAELGLEPDGRRAHLIPYGTDCQLIIDYKGLAELAMRSGLISNIHADVVRENDVFEYDLGEIKTHKIDFRKPRGEVFAVYALVRFKDGTFKAEVMNREEVEAIRKRSKAGRSGPWMTDWNEMAKKTVFRRLSKWLPLSPEHRELLERDADSFPPIQPGGFDPAPPAVTVHAFNAEPSTPEIPIAPAPEQEKKKDPTPDPEPEEIDAEIEEGINIIGGPEYLKILKKMAPGVKNYKGLDGESKKNLLKAINSKADELAST